MKAKSPITGWLRATSCVLVLGFFINVELKARPFTSTDGKTIEGELLELRGDKVVIKIGRKNYTLPKSRFSNEDQTYFVEWEKKAAETKVPKLDVKISPGENRKASRNDGYDDQSGSFDFSIAIENDEQMFNVKGAKGTLVVFGENCENDDVYNVYQKSTMELSVDAGQTWNWQGKEVAYEYDDNHPSLWGFKYYGYVFQIKNAAGNVIFSKAMPKKFEGVIEEALSLKEGMQVDQAMQKNGASYSVHLK